MNQKRQKNGVFDRLRRRKWILLRALTFALLVLIAGVFILQYYIVLQAQGKTYDDVSEVSGQHVGVVFGCDDRFQDRENLYFRYRMEAAAALWRAGKLKCVIVSGDNRNTYYNEPKKMKRALMARGVPSEKIVCDFAGLRTLDSVVRAKSIFGLNQCLFISQRFQNERAIMIAEAHGMVACGFNAQDVSGPASRKTKLREFAARLKMWLDLYLLDTKPRHGGERIALPILEK